MSNSTVEARLAAAIAQSPRHTQQALLAEIRDDRVGEFVEAWRSLPDATRIRAGDIILQWIESPSDSVVVDLGEIDGMTLLGLAARVAGLVGDAARFGEALVERLNIGPPCAEVAIACGRLGLETAREPLLAIAATEPRLRHAALLGLIWLDPHAALPELVREHRDAADLMNDAAASRGSEATQSTFQSAIELIVHRVGREFLITIADELRGQNPAKDALLADYLVAVAREPALPTSDGLDAAAIDDLCRRIRDTLS